MPAVRSALPALKSSSIEAATSMLMTFVEPLLDTLGPLLQRREDEDVSPDATNATIARVDARIAGQLDALSVTGGACLSSFLGDEFHALAVMASWVASAEPPDHVLAWKHLTGFELTKLTLLTKVVLRHGGPSWRAFARAQSHEVLVAVCGELPAHLSVMIAALTHDAPMIREWAWRHLPPAFVPNDAHLVAALADPATNEACIAHLCQRRDARLDRVLLNDLRWAARLAEPRDAATVAEKLWASSNGFDGLSRLGRPADVERLIEVLAHPDPLMAIAAGVAFTRLTGADITTTQRVTLPVADGEDPAFADDAWLPDQQRAKQAWRDLKPKLGDAQRIAGGYRVEDPEHPELPRSALGDLLLRRCRAG